jgi:hypothetical protein
VVDDRLDGNDRGDLAAGTLDQTSGTARKIGDELRGPELQALEVDQVYIRTRPVDAP